MRRGMSGCAAKAVSDKFIPESDKRTLNLLTDGVFSDIMSQTVNYD
ncbi:MAG: hypothetical protein LBK46_09020 [Oscillospiraceae bacterium]|nr:hypothetical protein [Oscillospiraceae bacterium]